MDSKKRNLEDDTSLKADKPLETTSNIVPGEIDFPRGGGTTLTPQEVKAIRFEAMTEADDLFKVRNQCVVSNFSHLYARKEHEHKAKRLRRKSDAKGKGRADEGGKKKTTAIRIEHLNYKVCLQSPTFVPSRRS